MAGTLVCGVDDSGGGRRALELSADLSARLGLRLVLVHVAEVVVRLGSADLDGDESFWRDRQAAQQLLVTLAGELDGDQAVELRVAVGDVAGRLAQIAAEEAADLIVVGAERKGRIRRRLVSGTLHRLDTETPVPVLVALPRSHARPAPTLAAG